MPNTQNNYYPYQPLDDGYDEQETNYDELEQSEADKYDSLRDDNMED